MDYVKALLFTAMLAGIGTLTFVAIVEYLDWRTYRLWRRGVRETMRPMRCQECGSTAMIELEVNGDDE